MCFIPDGVDLLNLIGRRLDGGLRAAAVRTGRVEAVRGVVAHGKKSLWG
jgi:hypothetical protein